MDANDDLPAEPAPDDAHRDRAAASPYADPIGNDAGGLRFALAVLGYGVRYNVRAQRHEWLLANGWAEGNDRLDARVREEISTGFRFKNGKPAAFGRDTWARSLDAVLYDNEADPFRDWLVELPRWDGVARLSHWLGEVFETDGGRLAEWAARFVYLGAVARAVHPGLKLDEMPVLIGPQGCGKSTALALALPPDQPCWFSDGLNLAATSKERAEALLGRVIVEASEMAGSTRAEIENLKSFLSRTDDGAVRLAYRRNPETMLRRSIIIGTTNDENCLPNDPSGNRRFVVVRVRSSPGGVPALRDYLNRYRGQLWAEALYVYACKLDIVRLPDHLKNDQRNVNEQHRRTDEILEEKLDEWLRTSAPDFFPMSLAAAGIGWNDKSDDQRVRARLSKSLKALGCAPVQRRIDGRPRRGWERPA